MSGRHHRMRGNVDRDHASLLKSYIKVQIHDGYDATGNTFVDAFKLDMNG